jgi:glycosyltransferase involved in cell wall biosynthesis
MSRTQAEPPSGRLIYLANIGLLSDRPHVLQVFKNCEAFAKLGLDVHLVHPGRKSTVGLSETDCFAFYGVDPCFAVREVKTPDLVGLNLPDAPDRLAFLLQGALFARAAARRYRDDLLYTRDFTVATLLSAARRDFLFEVHSLPTRSLAPRWLRFVSRRALGVVVISRHLAEDCRALGISAEALCVAPDAVDRRLAERRVEVGEARRRLGLPREAFIAAYTGHFGRFYAWKGLDTVLRAAQILPDILFVLVGGSKAEVDEVAASVRELGLSNVRLPGWVPPGDVADYLAAANVLLLPNSARSVLSARHTSPMKAFEYMAAGKPIVASDLPSLREIYDQGVDALLVPPDDPGAIACAIERLLRDTGLGERLSAAAREKAKRSTWEARAEVIVEFARRRGARLPAPAMVEASASP